MVDKDISFWKSAIFVDESKCNIFGSDGRIIVWRKPNEELNPKNLLPTVMEMGGGIMVWGYFATSDMGNLVFIEMVVSQSDRPTEVLNERKSEINGEYCRPPLGLSLDGNVAENRRKFKQQFTIYLKTSGHDKKDSDVKVAIFFNAVGEEAIELFNTFDLQEDDRNDCDKVLTAFENHITPKTNVVVQRFIFSSLMQDIDESFDAFYTDLRKLVKSCEFENQADSVVRDRIILGIADSGLQERLLQEGNLSLARAAEIFRAAELSKKQAQTVQTKSVDALQKKKFQSVRFNRAGGNQQQTQAANNKSGAFSGANNDIGNASGADGDQRAHVTNNNNVYICKKCNRKHRRSECPVFGKQCFVCGNYNHFSVVCQMRSVQDVTCITENKETEPYVVTDVQSDFLLTL
ncbi:hypothetical protein AVEN_141187-1 [Araneus ventricosus]|uniref:CCHC-type domain-containing protein n=1 Tax=Araneus ventricosus TaxID=182803 RepID=A0A4Y2ETJ2_ARAVE|nr:hypothetical protein AVEN_141187-1 [Araneus ventricosus]